MGFPYDTTTLPTDKVTLLSVIPGEEQYHVLGEDLVECANALLGVRDAIIYGQFFGFQPQDPDRPTMLDENRAGIWANVDGRPMWWDGVSEYDMLAGGGGGYTTVQNAGVSVTQRTTLNLLNGEIVAADASSKTTLALATALLAHEFRTTAGGAGSVGLPVAARHIPTGSLTAGEGVAYSWIGRDGGGDPATIATVTTILSTEDDRCMVFEVGDDAPNLVESMRVWPRGLGVGLATMPEATVHVSDANGGGLSGLFTREDSGTNTVLTAAALRRTTSATAAAGIGVSLLLQSEDGSGNVQDTADIAGVLSVVTNTSEKGYIRLRAMDGSGAQGDSLYAWGTGRVAVGRPGTTEPAQTFFVKTKSGLSASDVPMAIDKIQANPAADTRMLDLYRNSGSVLGGLYLGADDVVYLQGGEASWTSVSFTNSWANAAGYSTAQYRKDALGFVHMKGVIDTGTPAASAFTLPAGYRPGQKLSYFNGSANVTYNTDGTVVPSSTTGAILDGFTFLAEG